MEKEFEHESVESIRRREEKLMEKSESQIKRFPVNKEKKQFLIDCRNTLLAMKKDGERKDWQIGDSAENSIDEALFLYKDIVDEDYFPNDYDSEIFKLISDMSDEELKEFAEETCYNYDDLKEILIYGKIFHMYDEEKIDNKLFLGSLTNGAGEH